MQNRGSRPFNVSGACERQDVRIGTNTQADQPLACSKSCMAEEKFAQMLIDG